jgi:predicted membrane metal-binding protein
MFLLLAILLLGLQLQWTDLHNFSAQFTEVFHLECVRLAPDSPWRELYEATVCGKNLREPEFLGYLKKFGLLHLIVVSGAHLLFLEKLVHSVGLRAKTFVYPLLILFSLVTLLQPPITRALIAIFLGDLNVRFRLFWHPVQIIFFSGILCWLLFPSWIHSFSFLLSWSCSLILCLVSGYASWKKHLAIYFFMCFFLLPLQTPHPLSILLNMFLAPVIGLCLFPASLLAFAIPSATSLVDPLWSALYHGLQWMDRHLDSASLHHPTTPLILWTFLWTVHLAYELRLKVR